MWYSRGNDAGYGGDDGDGCDGDDAAVYRVDEAVGYGGGCGGCGAGVSVRYDGDVFIVIGWCSASSCWSGCWFDCWLVGFVRCLS